MTAVQKGIPYVKGKDDILSFCWSKVIQISFVKAVFGKHTKLFKL